MSSIERQPLDKILPPEDRVLNDQVEEMLLSFTSEPDAKKEMLGRKSEAAIQRAIRKMIGMDVRHGQDSWKITNVKRAKKGGFDVTLVRNASAEEIKDKRGKLPTGVNALKVKDVSLSDLAIENPDVFGKGEEGIKKDSVQ